MSINKFIAKAIIDELGGNRFIASTGHKNFRWHEKTTTLSFDLSLLAQEQAKGDTIKIEYNSLTDSYDVSLCKFYTPTSEIKKTRDIKIKLFEELEKEKNVFCFELKEVVMRLTGVDNCPLRVRARCWS